MYLHAQYSKLNPLAAGLFVYVYHARYVYVLISNMTVMPEEKQALTLFQQMNHRPLSSIWYEDIMKTQIIHRVTSPHFCVSLVGLSW